MKVKSEELFTLPNNSMKTHQPQYEEEEEEEEEEVVSGNKVRKAWSMASLMAEIPISTPSIHSECESPILPCDSCRPSTVFYSPTRYQDLKSSCSFSNLKKQFPGCTSVSSSYESVTKFGILGGLKNNELHNSSATYNHDSLHDVTGANAKELYSIPHTISEEDSLYRGKRGTATATVKSEDFGEAIPVADEGLHKPRLSHRLKPYHEFLDEVQSQKQRAELDAMRKARYTHLLRKLTKKEEAIDEWESNRRRKVEAQMDKLERKLEQKRAEAAQKVHKKIAETKQEAQKRKAKARKLALKEMVKHCPLQN